MSGLILIRNSEYIIWNRFFHSLSESRGERHFSGLVWITEDHDDTMWSSERWVALCTPASYRPSPGVRSPGRDACGLYEPDGDRRVESGGSDILLPVAPCDGARTGSLVAPGAPVLAAGPPLAPASGDLGARCRGRHAGGLRGGRLEPPSIPARSAGDAVPERDARDRAEQAPGPGARPGRAGHRRDGCPGPAPSGPRAGGRGRALTVPLIEPAFRPAQFPTNSPQS